MTPPPGGARATPRDPPCQAAVAMLEDPGRTDDRYAVCRDCLNLAVVPSDYDGLYRHQENHPGRPPCRLAQAPGLPGARPVRQGRPRALGESGLRQDGPQRGRPHAERRLARSRRARHDRHRHGRTCARRSRRQPCSVLQEPRLLLRQQRPVHIAVRTPRLRRAIPLCARPDEPCCQVIPRPADEGVRVREQEIAHDGTLIREQTGGRSSRRPAFRC